MKNFLFALFLLLVNVATLQAQTPYYQGKTIRIISGFPAGDVNDLWLRLIGQYMSKYIPGNPTFIVQKLSFAVTRSLNVEK